jgi:pilus assembly protein FimV
MNRSLKLSVLAALALGSSQALALNLGQIQVKSALGQPLRVEIPVNPASPAELQNLSARLASSDAFTRAGITDGRPSVPLQFKVADEHGHKVILVTSSVPVNNPYIDLLIEVSSAAGTSVHEYPVLLDPPAGKLAAATSGNRHAGHHAAASHAAPASPRPSTTARQAPAAGVKNGEYGPVQRGQTLSAVARNVAPDGVNVDQMMLALKQANPDAFYRDNINALKAGAVLRVPSRDDALAMKVAEAAAAVRRQNSDWSGGATRRPTSVAAAATRANASTSPTSHASTGDRLALVPAGDSGQGAGSGGGKHGSVASLRQDLQRSQETLSSLQQQSADLNSRLKDLKDINSKNQRLLSLKDNEIAALQAKLAAARKAAGLPPPKPLPATPAPAEAASSNATAPLVAAVTAHEAPKTAVAPAHAGTASTATTPAVASSTAATAPVVAAPKPAVKKPVVHPRPAVHPAPPPEQPWYMQTWAMIAGAAIVVLGLLMLLASRGRRGKAATPGRPTPPSSLADRFGDAPIPSAAGGADPDQDELLDQLAEHPDDVGLHLELVSLYYSRRDVEHFEAAAEAMYAHVSSPEQDEWQDVVHMGEDLTPGHPLFAHADESHAHHDADVHDEVVPPRTEDEIQALNEFDLDSYADEAPVDASTGPTPPPLRANQKVSEYHFDFNLTPQQARAQAAAEEAEAAAAPVQPVEPAVAPKDEAVSSWNFDEPATTSHAEPAGDEFGDFGELNDDPVDTKLDLARAYLDMGDPDGARAMLEEVLQEGTQMQKDVAKGLLEKLA